MYCKILTMKSVKRVVKTNERNLRNLQTKTKIETIIGITKTFLLGITLVKVDFNLIKTK